MLFSILSKVLNKVQNWQNLDKKSEKNKLVSDVDWLEKYY